MVWFSRGMFGLGVIVGIVCALSGAPKEFLLAYAFLLVDSRKPQICDMCIKAPKVVDRIGFMALQKMAAIERRLVDGLAKRP